MQPQPLLTPRQAVYRILAAAWDSASLPPAELIPWEGVLRLVGPSNVGALAHVLAAPLRDAMPPEVRALLEQAFYRTAAANARSYVQLRDVAEHLAAVGAPPLLLKGAALAETYYPDPALRLIGDIDLAVPPEWVGRCRDRLVAMGYTPSRVDERPGRLLETTNQIQLEPPQGSPVSVELHWHIIDVPYYMRRIPMSWFWDHSEQMIIAGQTFRVLDAEANVVYLSAHLALHHGFRGLHSLLDLALLIVKTGARLDWDTVIQAAQEFDLVCALSGTLDRLAEAWPSLPVNAPRCRLRAITPGRQDARLYRLLTTERRSPTLQFYAALISMPRLGARARYVATHLFPQPAYMRERYDFASSWQLPGWYLYRLGEGLLRLARTMLATDSRSGSEERQPVGRQRQD